MSIQIQVLTFLAIALGVVSMLGYTTTKGSFKQRFSSTLGIAYNVIEGMGIGLLIAFVLGCLFTSCSPKYNVIKEKEIVMKDTVIFRPSVTVHDTLRLRDTLVYSNLTEKIVYSSDSSMKVELSYLRDRMNNLIIRCNAIPDTIKVPVEVIKIKTVKVDNDDRKEGRNTWIYIALGVGFFLILAIAIKQVLK